YLCTLFKDLVHCRPFEYITEYRINRAKELLVTNPEMKISEVANTVGYENKSYFGTNFRKIEGISPRSYRDLHQSD
ncbi:MAG: helix-turn-helix domain-containing protein, partial [Spirochaetota bacterium]